MAHLANLFKHSLNSNILNKVICHDLIGKVFCFEHLKKKCTGCCTNVEKWHNLRKIPEMSMSGNGQVMKIQNL